MASLLDPRAREFRDVFYDALAGAQPGVRDADPVSILSSTTERARIAAVTDDAAIERLEPLSAIAASPALDSAIEAASARYESAEVFREAVLFARCLVRDAEAALSLLQARRYLEDAALPTAQPELRTDRDAVLDAATFAALWQDPSRHAWMLTTTGIWRRDYAAVYRSRHASFNAAVVGLAERIDAAAAGAAAIERLNTLSRLGAPVGLAALMRFHELERLYACQLDAATLDAALLEAPACPACAFRLGDEAPLAESKRITAALDRGLSTQLTRLARRVVSRILERPAADADGDRLTRFIAVVQASDLAGLTRILDPSLLNFLRELLEGDAASDILSRLTDAYPEVTSTNLDAAVFEFRRLLDEGLAAADRVRLRRSQELLP